MYLILELFVLLIGTVISIVFAKRKIRPCFPLKVNCWFCNHNTTVPYGNRHCWDCPNCDQYNGFTSDGDYNKPVPAQYTESINHPVSCQSTEFLSRGPYLCPTCQRNQLLKVKQLASFEPLNEANYDEELDFYQRHLENVYALCLSCDAYVKAELKKLDIKLHEQLDSSGLKKPVSSPSPECSPESPQNLCSSVKLANIPWVFYFLLSIVTLLSSLCMLYFVLNRQYPLVGVLTTGWIEPSAYVDETGVAAAGLTGSIVSKLFLGKGRLYLRDVFHILLWLLALLCTIFSADLSFISAGFPSIPFTKCVVGLFSCVVLMELFIALKRRRPTNITYPVMRRLSLDRPIHSSSSDAVSEALSSVSTSCRQGRLAQPGSFSRRAEGRENCSETHPMHQKGDVKERRVTNSSGPELKVNDVDKLQNELGSFKIGSPLKSDSGYSSGRSSIFASMSSQFPAGKSSIFASMSSPLPAVSQVELASWPHVPHPVVLPPKLRAVAFSSDAVYGTQRAAKSNNETSSLLNAVGEDGYSNPFMSKEPRPLTMFPLKKDSSRPFRSSSNYPAYSLQRSPSNFISIKEPVYRKASSEIDFDPFPGHWRKAEYNVDVCNRPAQSGKATSELDFSLLDLKSRCSKSAQSWWRDSSSEIGVGSGDQMRDPMGTEDEGDRETPERGIRPLRECDTTTPELTGFRISSTSVANSSRQRKTEDTGDTFGFSDNSDDDDEASYGGKTFVTHVTCSPREGISWMVYLSVTVVVVSVATNLFLAWALWSR